MKLIFNARIEYSFLILLMIAAVIFVYILNVSLVRTLIIFLIICSWVLWGNIIKTVTKVTIDMGSRKMYCQELDVFRQKKYEFDINEISYLYYEKVGARTTSMRVLKIESSTGEVCEIYDNLYSIGITQMENIIKNLKGFGVQGENRINNL